MINPDSSKICLGLYARSIGINMAEFDFFEQIESAIWPESSTKDDRVYTVRTGVVSQHPARKKKVADSQVQRYDM